MTGNFYFYINKIHNVLLETCCVLNNYTWFLCNHYWFKNTRSILCGKWNELQSRKRLNWHCNQFLNQSNSRSSTNAFFISHNKISVRSSIRISITEGCVSLSKKRPFFRVHKQIVISLFLSHLSSYSYWSKNKDTKTILFLFPCGHALQVFICLKHTCYFTLLKYMVYSPSSVSYFWVKCSWKILNCIKNCEKLLFIINIISFLIQNYILRL